MAQLTSSSNPIKDWLASDMASGIILAVAAVLAMVVANSAAYDWYAHVLHIPLGFALGGIDARLSLLHWINDGLMAVFFLLVGLELKREMLVGELSDIKRIVLPALAAVGGMLVPALIYVGFNQHDASLLRGWAIPSATDIAFALGVIALLGARVPASLKIFLASIAIFDDIGAILIIALFYSAGLSWGALGVAALALAMLWGLNRMGVRALWAYLLVGVVLWAAMLQSGIHATIAGVLLALCIPMGNKAVQQDVNGASQPTLDEDNSPLSKLEHALHAPVNFIILPIFAFANAGIALGGSGLSQLTHSVPLGIAAGLVLGKPIGVMLFSWLGVRTGMASLPQRVTWAQVLGVALLCGIGFTMSLFIGGLAFGELGDKAFDERLGIMVGSLVAGTLGYVWLNKVLPRLRVVE